MSNPAIQLCCQNGHTMPRGADWCQECGEPPRKENRVETHATDVECPTCYAWVGWACNGSNYGYHAAGYHPARERAAKRADEAKAIDLATLQATPQARTADE